MGATYTKDPEDALEYQFDFTDWLGSGETISSVVWNVPTGITNDGDSFDTTKGYITLSGGTVGESYKIECKITTNKSPPQTKEESITITIAEA